MPVSVLDHGALLPYQNADPVDFLMIVSSIASVTAYMIRSKSVLNSVKSIQNNPYEVVHFYSALDWANWEDASIAVVIFMATLKLLNLIRFKVHLTPKYFFRLNKSLHLFETQCAF